MLLRIQRPVVIVADDCTKEKDWQSSLTALQLSPHASKLDSGTAAIVAASLATKFCIGPLNLSRRQNAVVVVLLTVVDVAVAVVVVLETA